MYKKVVLPPLKVEEPIFLVFQWTGMPPTEDIKKKADVLGIRWIQEPNGNVVFEYLAGQPLIPYAKSIPDLIGIKWEKKFKAFTRVASPTRWDTLLKKEKIS